jgi:hypothetical protein
MAPDEGTPDEGLEEQQEPVAPVSATPPEPASQDFVSKADLSELKDEIQGWIRNGTERTKQSQRDAIKARVPQMVRETLAQELAAIEKYAPSEKQKQLQIDALLSHLTTEPSEPEEQPAPSRPDETFVEKEIRGVLNAHGLTGNEPELKKYMSDAKGQDLYPMLKGLENLSVELAEKRKATPAGILPGTGSTPAKPDLQEKYIQEISDLRVDRTMQVHTKRERLKEIKKKYKELGVPVDQIGFRI